MRRLILFSFVAVGLFLAGCSDQSSLVGPTQQISQQQGKVLIDLPVTGLFKSIKASEKIDGSVGGTVELNGKINDNIEVHATLVIPAGAFTGSRNISVKLDDKTASFKFGPSGTFDAPLSFSATISGVDAGNSNLSFSYVDNSGNFSSVTTSGVGTDSGTLYVNNAQLNHFSRYGWSK